MIRSIVIEDIHTERANQDKKWGEYRTNTPRTWLTILMEEVGEVAKATLENDYEGYYKELIQVAAVAVAALEDVHRYEREGATDDHTETRRVD
jgi:NTP pyrophosphatase (non-canonical NTP hydrolase)